MKRTVFATLLAFACAGAASPAWADEFTGWSSLTTDELFKDGKNAYENTSYPKTQRKPTDIRYIVIHQTGSALFGKDGRSAAELYRERYRSGTAPHYMVEHDGTISQFVPDAYSAQHAGVDSKTVQAYADGATGDCSSAKKNWRCIWPGADWKSWSYGTSKLPAYDAWDERWGGDKSPSSDLLNVNGKSIGIELLSYADSKSYKEEGVLYKQYTEEQYKSLVALVQNLAEKYQIPLARSRILFHSDINPVLRTCPPNDGKSFLDQALTYLYDPGPHFTDDFFARVGAADDLGGGGTAAPPAEHTPPGTPAAPTTQAPAPPPSAPPPEAPLAPAPSGVPLKTYATPAAAYLMGDQPLYASPGASSSAGSGASGTIEVIAETSQPVGGATWYRVQQEDVVGFVKSGEVTFSAVWYSWYALTGRK